MIDTRSAPYAAFLLRLMLGVMYLAHGMTKWLVFTLPGTAQFFAKIGFAGWLAYPVTFFEIVGGVFLILGIVPRWVALAGAVQLLVAASVHFGNGWGFGN
ncbi:DoxX family protein, partial [Bordetella hinzii]|nr:DoxX family protein [Bordetella hinzii]